jgi:drug/metabolite transporter (DMT)-like permease
MARMPDGTAAPAAPFQLGADRPLVGVLLMLGFCALAPLGDAIAKLLGDRVPLAELIGIRFAVQAAMLVAFAWLTGRSLRMDGRVFRLTALRTALHVVAIGALFLALRYLPLADAIAIAFVMPFIMLLLGRFVLDEAVGPRRLAACAVGFVGTLLVIQPSFASVGAAALLPLLVALTFALFMLVTRQIARDTDPIALQAVSGVMASVVLLPVVALADGRGWAGLDPVAPGRAEWFLLMLLGAIGTVAHLLMTWSLRFAPASTLAPMQYLEIPFATLIGLAVFGDLPNGTAALGIAVTVAAGLYVIHRERRAALDRRIRPAPPPV